LNMSSAVDVCTVSEDRFSDPDIVTSEMAESEEKSAPMGASRAPSAEDTVIIFDWDDTLLSSSWLATNGLRLDEPQVIPAAAMKLLAQLEASVVTLLEKALAYGHVAIITNAETGWVELSARRFMPAVVNVLPRFHVLSARSTFECLSPDNPGDWKIHAFHHKISEQFGVHSDRLKNVLSFGDSIHERHAVHKVTSSLRNVHTKSIKFVERPSVEQLKRQVDLVLSCINDIAYHKGDLDLMLTIQLLYS